MADPKTPAEATISEELKRELAELTNTQRAAVLMLLLGEDLASNIISYLDPKEVQELGAAMVSVADMSVSGYGMGEKAIHVRRYSVHCERKPRRTSRDSRGLRRHGGFGFGRISPRGVWSHGRCTWVKCDHSFLPVSQY